MLIAIGLEWTLRMDLMRSQCIAHFTTVADLSTTPMYLNAAAPNKFKSMQKASKCVYSGVILVEKKSYSMTL